MPPVESAGAIVPSVTAISSLVTAPSPRVVVPAAFRESYVRFHQ